MQNGTEVYLAKLAGTNVFDPNGDSVGKVRDVVLTMGKNIHPRAVGFVVEVSNKRRVFLPLTRVTSITSGQIIVTGLLNMRRFQQREIETLAFSQLFDRVINIPTWAEGEQARIEDVSIVLQASGEWRLTKLFVRKLLENRGIFGRKKGETSIISVGDAELVHDSTKMQSAAGLLESIEGMKPADIAEVLGDLDDKRRSELAKELDNQRLAQVLEEMPESDQISILSNFDQERVADVLEEMQPDDAADLLGQLPETEVSELLELMDEDDADDVRQLLEYGEDTAGGLMTTGIVILDAGTTVAAALAQIRRKELPPSLASAVFICRSPLETPTGHFVGVVHFQELLRVPPHSTLGHVVDTDVPHVTPHTPIERVTRVMATYNLMILPVLDADKSLLGAISADDVLDHMLPSNWREEDL